MVAVCQLMTNSTQGFLVELFYRLNGTKRPVAGVKTAVFVMADKLTGRDQKATVEDAESSGK